MPCRNDWDEGAGYRDACKEIDNLTRMLCKTCQQVVAGGFSLDKETQKWWNIHQEKDAIRLKREEAEKREKKLKEDALKKLTPEERSVLGIR